MSDALPAFGPQARSAAIAAGACVLLGAGVYLYPRSASSAAPRDEPRKQKSRAKAAARRENAQSASDDDYDSGSASSSPKRAALPLSAGPPALNPVAIFWDVDNCAPPTGSSGRAIVQSIRKAVQSVGPASVRGPGDGGEPLAASGPIVSFKAYLEMSDASAAPSQAQVNLRSELQGCGVSLIDTPKSGRKDVADKMLITDMLAYAIDQPSPARIVLISGDRDMAYPLGCLRNRSYSVLLITPPVGAPPILEASANVCLRWRQDVLGMEVNGYGRPYSGPSAGVSSPAKRPTAAPVVAETPKAQKSSTNLHLAAGASASKFITGPGGQPVAPVFAPLVQVLEDFRKDGKPRPLRTSVSIKLLSADSQIYQKAGAAKWSDYAAVAEAAGYITLGSAGHPGSEWVALRSIAAPGSPLHGSPIAPATPSTPAASTLSKTSAALRSGAASAPPTQPKFMAVESERPKSALPNRAASPVKQLARPESPVKRPSQQAVPTAPAAAATSSPLKKTASSTGSGAPAAPATAKPLPGFTLADFEKLMPCQPSGGLAPVPFFPLANYLGNARRDGRMVVPAETLRKYLMTSTNVKHTRLSNLARSPDAWLVLLQRAEEAEVLVIDASSPEMATPLRLHPRLVVDKKPKRGARSTDGSAGAATESDDSDDSEDGNSEEAASVKETPAAAVKKTTAAVEEKPAAIKETAAETPVFKDPPAAVKDTPAARPIAPLPRSGTSTPTPEAAASASAAPATPDVRARANYKPLVTVLVRLRKETGQREVLRSKVGLEVVRINPAASAAEWYAAHGAPEGFRQYTQQAQEAGFVRFSPRGTQSGYEWIALAPKYEDMFFSSEEGQTSE